MLRTYLFVWTTLLTFAACNTEKVIFTVPHTATLPRNTFLDNLYLTSLNPQHSTLRTHLNASFPTDQSVKGSQTWILLEGLTLGQRYEVRVCWLATQPTSFWLYTHDFMKVMQTPDLIAPLSAYATKIRAVLNELHRQQLRLRRFKDETSTETSLLLLQIYAAADYFSLDDTLMENVPPVLVDIILDPYIMNILPQSLVPTIFYIAIIAVVAWFTARWLSSYLRRASRTNTVSQVARSKKRK